MKALRFSLQPAPAAASPPDMEIAGSVSRRNNTLAIRYALSGRLEDIIIPAPKALPIRRDGLWEETCLELFLAAENSPRYWEFNVTPAGHWNVYRFTDYREGMREEPAFTSLPVSVVSRQNSLVTALELDLDKIVKADQGLEVAISAVIRWGDGQTTYWALTHRSPQADFHRRDSFIVKL